jgi:hypothetical protein
MNLIEAIARLRAMQEQYEHDNRGAGPDFYEVERFFDWAEKRERAAHSAGEQRE